MHKSSTTYFTRNKYVAFEILHLYLTVKKIRKFIFIIHLYYVKKYNSLVNNVFKLL